jgi:adenosylhomocysteinase
MTIRPDEPSRVRDPGLAPAGALKIAWAERHMPVLAAAAAAIAARGSLRGLRVGISVHLEAKTACLALALQRAGAEVVVTGSNPLSTQDDVCAALAAAGPRVYAWHDPTPAEYAACLAAVVASGPDVMLDDGADLSVLAHRDYPEVVRRLRGATEETTTGLHRLRAMARAGVLGYPVLAGNDARMKYLFDNRHGIGQSVLDGILRATNLLLAGKEVAVFGYGWGGRGLARRAQGMGARVLVCEVDPVKANEALLDGCEVLPASEAAARAEILITCTGCAGVLTREHFLVMRDGAVLCNAGHFDVEVDVAALRELAVARAPARANVEAYRLPNGRTLYLVAEGRLVNLAAADGHPVEIMDISFALQALALEYVAVHGPELPRAVVPVPEAIDEQVARLRLEALGVRIDALSPAQAAYLESWQ